MMKGSHDVRLIKCRLAMLQLSVLGDFLLAIDVAYGMLDLVCLNQFLSLDVPRGMRKWRKWRGGGRK